MGLYSPKHERWLNKATDFKYRGPSVFVKRWGFADYVAACDGHVVHAIPMFLLGQPQQLEYGAYMIDENRRLVRRPHDDSATASQWPIIVPKDFAHEVAWTREHTAKFRDGIWVVVHKDLEVRVMHKCLENAMSLHTWALMFIQQGDYKPVKLEFKDGEFAVLQSFAKPKEKWDE